MTEENSYDIFISYRRDGGRDAARLLYKELEGRGYKCFFDFNSLRSGQFDEHIFEAIKSCRYFILMVTDGAFERCFKHDDWVRMEIEFALKNGKEIVPVAPSDNPQCFPAEIPEFMEHLRKCEVSELNMGKLFERSVDQIIEDRFSEEFKVGAGGKDVCAPEIKNATGIGGILAYALMPLTRYADFVGRSSRREFWLFMLLYCVLLGVVESLFGASFILSLLEADSGEVSVVSSIVSFALICPAIAVTVRRLHDTGKSGVWFLLLFIPIIGIIPLLYLLVQPSASTGRRLRLR